MKSFSAMVLSVLAVVTLTGCTILVEPRGAPRDHQSLDLSDRVLNQRRIFVAGNITETSAAETIRQLMFLDAQSTNAITIYLMTPGGDLKAAFAVVHAIHLLRSKVNTCAIGECNSGGVMLLASGTGERMAFPDSALVIHGIELKNKPPAKYVQTAQEGYTAFWREHARLPNDWLPIPLGQVRVLTSQDALNYSIIDRIVTPRRQNAEQSGSTAPGRSSLVPDRTALAPGHH